MTDHDYLRPVPLRVGLGDELRIQLEGGVLLLAGGAHAERVAKHVVEREGEVVDMGLGSVVVENPAGDLVHHEGTGGVGVERTLPQDGLLPHR